MYTCQKIRLSNALSLFAFTALSSCTSYNAVRVSTPEAPVPIAGAQYSLPFTQYEITVQRRLVACTDENKEAALGIGISATTKTSEKPDPVRGYISDMTSLDSIWKTTAMETKPQPIFGIESINASAEDRAGPAMVSIATTLAKIVAASAGAGAGVAVSQTFVVDGQSYNEVVGACLPEIAIIINRLKADENAIKTQTRLLARKAKVLALHTAISADMGKDYPAADKADLAKLRLEVEKESQALSILEEKLADNLSKLTVTNTVLWPPNGATFGEEIVSTPLVVGAQELPKPAEFKAIRIVDDLDRDTIAKWGSGNDGPSFRKKTGVYAKIISTSPLGLANTCTTSCPDDKLEGFKYRPASSGYLLICKEGDCQRDDKNAVAVSDGLISQLGRVFVIPLNSGLFSKKTLATTFDKNGQVTMIGLKSTSASAEEGAKTIASLVDTIDATRNKLKPTELEMLNAKTAQLKAENDYRLAKAALVPAANAEQAKAAAAFTADTALIQARLANIAAQDALDKALGN